MTIVQCQIMFSVQCQLSGSVIEQVLSYKLLTFDLLHNLLWSIHCYYYCEESTQASPCVTSLKEFMPPTS